MAAKAKKQPCDRLGWHGFYVKLFNKTGRDTAAQMAM